MLTRKVRIWLLVALGCLLVVHIYVLPPNSLTVSDKMILEQVDQSLREQNYAEAIQLLNSTINFHPQENNKLFLSRLETAEKFYASETAFSRAKEYYQAGDFQRALVNFKKVEPEDVKNFTAAREKICELELDLLVVK